MPWNAQGQWTPEDDSVVTRLNGLLASDSTYIQQARAAGTRTASRRGLLNSSIAAGAAESAAIAAGAPLASQDAQVAAGRNQAVLEGGINLNNQRTINEQQNQAALTMQERQAGTQMQLQQAQDAAALERQNLQQQGATEAQLREFDQRTAEQTAALSSSERTNMMQADTSLLQTRIGAQSNITSAYLNAFSALMGNPEIPAAARNSYIAEFQRVTQMGQPLAAQPLPANVTWGGQPAPTPTAAPTGTTTTKPQVNPGPTGKMIYENGEWRVAA